jgi:2-octaprenylphenol hydroxylase
MTENQQLNGARFDVAIVGAGLVGSTLARLLSGTGLHVALIDRQAFDPAEAAFAQTQPAFDGRVSAITEASRTLFDSLGLWPQIAETRACPYQQMLVWDADGTGQINFSARELAVPELGHIVENSVLLSALFNGLSELEGLSCLFGQGVSSLQLAATQNGDAQLQLEDGATLSARLVVAADGSRSRIRSMAGFSTREWDYEHTAIVTTVKTELPHRQVARQRFLSSGPLAFLPLASADDHYCSIVWSCVPELAERLMALGEPEFNRDLAVAIENQLGAVQWTDRRVAIPLRQMHATRYVRGNVALIGDAAHSIHPLAGQGVNLGFLDAAALAAQLERGLRAGRSVSDPMVLARYQRARQGSNLSMMWLMEGFKHLFAEEALPVRWLRNMGLHGVDGLSPIKNQLARAAMGL